MTVRIFSAAIFFAPALALALAGALQTGCGRDESTEGHEMTEKPIKTEEWRDQLSEQEHDILRCGGTEAPFSGAYWDTKTPGVYRCRGCGQELFDSSAKYDSGTGWPSFYQPVDAARVTTHTDTSGGMTRTEVVCSRCGGHLGHVFPDGPEPTGLRYCLNSASLKLVEREGE